MAEAQAPPAVGGVIHDLGYRGYDGPRLGRGPIVRALTWHSFRSARAGTRTRLQGPA